VLGLVTAQPVAVDDASFIDTSFPGFAALINRLAGAEALGDLPT
jgi:3-phosphoshikimate 1-carboxyvinyltransferase